jgi:hypothetical protein
MGKGLANALLISSREVFRGATPITKLTTPGFLQYLLQNNKPKIVSMAKDDGTGYLRDLKIRFRTRGVPGRSVTTDDCSVQVKPAYQELVVPATSYRAFGLCFEDDEIAKFESDSLAQLSAGNPTMTGIMKDVYEAIIEQANGFVADINLDLLALQAANFGKNATTGFNTAKAVNFPLSTATNPLASGMTDVMADAMANEMRLSGACIVGSGLINNYYLNQSAIPAGQGNQAGINTSMLALPNFYFDPYAQTSWGANQFGLFEKDAIQFVNTCRFRGAKAGQKGSDFFMTLRLPLIDSLGQGDLGYFEFDVQLAYRTCPSEIVINGGAPVQIGRGWNIILSCSYQTINIPSNSYEATDRLNQVNGTFLYSATNA